MRTFTDTEGRQWDVRIDVNAIRDVRAALDVNLLALMDEEAALLQRLTVDPVLLVDVLFVVCRRQADERAVTDEAFGRAMAGDAILHAADALVRGIVDFFPDARRRATLGKVLDKGTALAEILLQRMEAQAATLDAVDLDRLAMTLTGSAGSAPGSSASTPAG